METFVNGPNIAMCLWEMVIFKKKITFCRTCCVSKVVGSGKETGNWSNHLNPMSWSLNLPLSPTQDTNHGKWRLIYIYIQGFPTKNVLLVVTIASSGPTWVVSKLGPSNIISIGCVFFFFSEGPSSICTTYLAYLPPPPGIGWYHLWSQSTIGNRFRMPSWSSGVEPQPPLRIIGPSGADKVFFLDWLRKRMGSAIICRIFLTYK